MTAKEAEAMRTYVTVLLAGVLIGMATLSAMNGVLGVQESTAAAGRAQMTDQAATLHVATPAATDAEMVEKMDRMMDQCLAMMEMMSMMMGGDMAGMMGGEGMHGMEDTPTASPTPGT